MFVDKALDIHDDFFAHRDPAFVGGRSQVRCEHNIFEFEKRGFDRWFAFIDIQTRASDFPFSQHPSERRLVNNLPARRIDDKRMRFQ